MSTMNSRTLLTLHVGQAGTQIGQAAWELLCLEHNLNPDGTPKEECGEHGNTETAFVATANGRYLARSVFVDTEPHCIDEIRSGPYRELFSSRQLLSDNSDSTGNYVVGRLGYVKQLLPDTVERLRWLSEKTDTRPTVCLFHGAAGGTGSGFSVAALTEAADEVGLGHGALDWCVLGGDSAVQNSCQLLNTALYLDESQNLVRQVFCLSNSSLYKLCAAQLQLDGRATYVHVNRVLATAFSNLTATDRLPGSSISMSNILDSLQPFPHLRYSLLACAPFLTAEEARVDEPTVRSITASVLETTSQFADVDPRRGRHAAGFLLYRGAVGLAEAQRLAGEVTAQERVRCYDWAPSGFRAGVVSLPPLAAPGSGFGSPAMSVTMITSHSGISTLFNRLAVATNGLEAHDLFVHHYELAIAKLLAAKSDLQHHPQQLSQQQKKLLQRGRPSAGSARGNQPLPPAAETPAADETGSVHSVGSNLRNWMPRRSIGVDQRSHAVSDVFGVRARLTGAAGALTELARVYADEEARLPLQPHLDNSEDEREGEEENAEGGATNTTENDGEDVGEEGPRDRKRASAAEFQSDGRARARNDDAKHEGILSIITGLEDPSEEDETQQKGASDTPNDDDELRKQRPLQPLHQQPPHQRPSHQQPPHQQPLHQQPPDQQLSHQRLSQYQPPHQQPLDQQPPHQQQTDTSSADNYQKSPNDNNQAQKDQSAEGQQQNQQHQQQLYPKQTQQSHYYQSDSSSSATDDSSSQSNPISFGGCLRRKHRQVRVHAKRPCDGADVHVDYRWSPRLDDENRGVARRPGVEKPTKTITETTTTASISTTKAAALRHPAVAEAERILMKYRR